MKLQPVGRSLLVRVSEKEKKSVIITISAQSNEPIEACVMAVGEKVEAPVKEGDLVLLFPYCGVKIQQSGEPYLLIGEKEILGIIR